MKVTVIGTGYVGLVTGTCLAHCGNTVTCLDSAEEKIAMLRGGRIPIHEPGLAELVAQNVTARRLHFATSPAAVASSKVVFLTVGTPQGRSGAADLSALFGAVEAVAPHLPEGVVVVVKSTVPVGTNARVARRLRELLGWPCDVASNPEFLRQGSAVRDFMNPDRVVVGIRRPLAAECLRELYQPVLWQGAPYMVMTPESAELTKYAANSMLAIKIAFINEIATLCDSVGADVVDVRRAIGADHRIGLESMTPGAGYGGSCFPKDVRALLATAVEHRQELPLIEAVDLSNENHKHTLGRRIETYFHGDLRRRHIAVWGLAFKPETDDTRESPALALVDRLLAADAAVHVHDPQAMANTRRIYGEQIHYAASPAHALLGAEALALVTDWDVYRSFTPSDIRELMSGMAVFDGRNVFDPDAMCQAGLDYFPIGRPRRQARPDDEASETVESTVPCMPRETSEEMACYLQSDRNEP